MMYRILAKIQVITAKFTGRSCLNCKYNKECGFTCGKKHLFIQALLFQCWESKINGITKRKMFWLHHQNLAHIHSVPRTLWSRIKKVGKCECILCQSCKHKGCFKNRFADKFKIGSLLNSNCYEPEWKSCYDKEPMERENIK